MKNCPFCEAEIDENARFCLYCMTSLEDKQEIKIPKDRSKWWSAITAAVFVFVTIIALSLLLGFAKEPVSADKGASSSRFVTSAPQSVASKQGGGLTADNTSQITILSGDSSLSNGDNASLAQDAQITDKDNDFNSSAVSSSKITSSSKNSKSSSTVSSKNSTTSSATTSMGTTSVGTTNTGSTASVNTSIGTTSTSSTNSNNEAEDLAAQKGSFSYIAATMSNAYPTGQGTYAPENSIVITKVNYIAKDGNYVIPETIDGKKVAAIMPLAFSDASVSQTVKSVTLPSTVRTVWSNAFSDCVSLKDIYIKSDVIGIYTDAFADISRRTNTLTIHCKKDCRDFYYYYYRNIADKYGALYEEWNG